MKFKKLSLLVTEATDSKIIPEVIQFCKKHKSKLFVLFVLDNYKLTRLARLTHQKVKILHKKTEEEGWELLYYVEDKAAKSGIWTSLHLEEGVLINILRKYVKAYGIDLVFMKKKDEFKKLFVSCPAPIIAL